MYISKTLLSLNEFLKSNGTYFLYKKNQFSAND